MTSTTPMTGWLRRSVVAAVVVIGVVAGTALLGFEPDPVAVALLVVLALSVALVLTVPSQAATWSGPTPQTRLGRGADPATLAHLRHLESHQTARHPDAVVRDTLARLADQALQLRHGVRADSDRGRELLGPAACEVLDGPVVRLAPRRVDTVLRTIEEL